MCSKMLVNSLRDMIRHNKFNQEYIEDLTSILTSKKDKKTYYNKFNKVLSLVYSNVILFEDVFNSITSNTLYVDGNVFNNENSIKLINLIRNNKNINCIKITFNIDLYYCELNYLYTLYTLKDYVNVSISATINNIKSLFTNINFKTFIKDNIIYKLNIVNAYYNDKFQDIEDYIYELISKNKVINLNIKDYNLKVKPKKIKEALSTNNTLKTFNSKGLHINNELYEIFKKHNLLSSFIHYEDKNDYNTYYMYIYKGFDIENLCDLIKENEKDYYNEELNRYEYIFENLCITDYTFNSTFYELLKNDNRIKKLNFTRNNIDCKLLSEALTFNNTIQEIEFFSSNLRNFREFSNVIKYNKTIKTLKIRNSEYTENDFKEVFKFLQYNDTITTLNVYDCVSLDSINIISDSLKNNSSITKLTFKYDDSHYHINQLIDILQYNTTIKELSILSLNAGFSYESYFNPYYYEIERLCELIKLNKNIEKINLRNLSLGEEGYKLFIDALKYNNSIYSIKLPRHINKDRVFPLFNELEFFKFNTTLIEVNY